MGNILFVVRLLGVVSIVGLSACETSPKDKASAVVAARYPGKGELDMCKPYADALYKALKSKHIDAWEVYYVGGSGTESYKHAMVVYRDAGAYWYADNVFPYPTKSWGTTVHECVEDRCNIQAGPPGEVDIFSGPQPYCAILKIKSTAHGRSLERMAKHKTNSGKRLYAGQ